MIQTKTNQTIQLPEKTYIVGGYVRDKLLGIKPGDKDWLVVDSNHEEMKSLGFKKVGKDFPVYINPKTQEEFALARREKKIAKGYYGFDCEIENISLKEDLERRDITINAMAFKTNQSGNEKLIDPFFGADDLKNKLIKHTSIAFSEDPLRVLRVARFLAKFHHLGFQVHKDTLQLLKKMVQSGELNDLTVERIWLEVVKVSQTKNPSIFFRFLNEIRALDILFADYSKELNSDWFKALDGVFTQQVSEQDSDLIRLGLCFFGYSKKQELANRFKLSNQIKKLFKHLAFHQRGFNQLIQLNGNSQDLIQKTEWFCNFFNDLAVLNEKSLIDEFITLQMMVHSIDLTDPKVRQMVASLYAYLAVDVKAYLKEKKSKNLTKNIKQEIEQLREQAVYKALKRLLD